MNAKLLVVWYDVTELTPEQLGALEGEVTAQAESSAGDWGEGTGHPDVDIVYCEALDASPSMIQMAKRRMSDPHNSH